MDGYFRDSTHSWNLRDSRNSRWSWESSNPDVDGPSRAPFGGTTDSASRLVPLSDLPSIRDSSESLDRPISSSGPPPLRYNGRTPSSPHSRSQSIDGRRPSGRPHSFDAPPSSANRALQASIQFTRGPPSINSEFEYHYHNWSQLSLHSAPDTREARDPRDRTASYVPLHPLREVATLDREPSTWKKKKEKDPSLVTFDGPKDPLNPKNWPKSKKWTMTLIMSSYAFISPVSSSIIAPCLQEVGMDFNITSEVELKLTLSIFVLAYAIGPLFLGPLSEVFGRVRILQMSAAFYLVFNLVCGFAQSEAQLVIFRFLAGIGGSAPLAIGGGILGDIWTPAQRGRAVGIYQLAPLLGPAVGPIAGGFVAETTTWRWVFYATSAAAFIVQTIGFFTLKETYVPALLGRKAAALRKSTGDMTLHTAFEEDKTLPKVLRTASARPFRMITTQPIIQVIALYMAYIFGMFYLLLSTLPRVFRGVYGESLGVASLNYLSLGLGFVIGAQINSHLNIYIYRRLKKKNGDIGRPEYRIPQMFLASPLVPIGLFLYGWTVEYKTHWILPDIGILIFGVGSVICLSCMQVYIIDTYTRYSASGIAAAIVLRSLTGFGFPLFAQSMYSALGYGWGNSVLGFAAVFIGLPAPYFFWYFGERLRKKSTFAAG